MENRLIVGKSNDGKTTLAEHFRDAINPKVDPDAERTISPVLYCEAPPLPDESRLYSQILRSMGVPHRAAASACVLWDLVCFNIPRFGVKIILIDDIHHSLAGSNTQQHRYLNTIKFMGHELKISIVLLGIKQAFDAIQIDDQMLNRFMPRPLPTWVYGREYQNLLVSFESFLPLRHPSILAEPKLAKLLIEMSNGSIGELSLLLNEASKLAINSKDEKITEELLRTLDWIPFAERRERTLSLV